MITLNLLKLLEDNNFGTIDEDLFWEKLTLGKIGVYVSSLGDTNERGMRRSQTYELYSRGSSDVAGYRKLKEIVEFLNASYSVCTLPAVDNISEPIENITIMPLSSITNGGLDDNGRIIWTATGTIYY